MPGPSSAQEGIELHRNPQPRLIRPETARGPLLADRWRGVSYSFLILTPRAGPKGFDARPGCLRDGRRMEHFVLRAGPYPIHGVTHAVKPECASSVMVLRSRGDHDGGE